LSNKEAAPEVFLPGGKAPVEGQLFRNAGLAQALTLIAEQGAAAFYRGPIAAAIVANARSLGGTMESDDLAGFSPEWVEPVSTTYRGWRVSQLPPNGQGISVLEMLNLMETAPIGQWAAMSAEALHFKIESMRIAYADLRHYVSDPRFVKIPVAGMLDKSYAGKRAAAIDPQKANCQAAPGDFPGSGNTTYLAAVDSQGNIASWIQSVAGMWGSYVAVPGYGFHLQNRGSSFRLDPAHANTLAPRKRPFHTIIPGFLEKDSLRIGFGIMGGAVQPLAHAQFVSNVVDHGMNLQAALDAPRFIEGRSTRGVKPTGCELGLENRVPPEVRAALETKGHRIGLMGAFNLIYTGAGQAVMHDSATGLNAGASDPRADGAAVPGRPQ
jgi:gamma-glutamyltranspeptidase/glutathione hydrolase